MNLSFTPADNTNPLFVFLAEHFRPSELDALIEAILQENDPTDAERLDLLQSVRETFAPPGSDDADAEGTGPFAFMEHRGMQWLAVGMVPGPMTFLCGTDTRAEAIDYLKNEYRGETFEYFAVVKARDLFAVP